MPDPLKFFAADLCGLIREKSAHPNQSSEVSYTYKYLFFKQNLMLNAKKSLFAVNNSAHFIKNLVNTHI